MLFFGTYKSWNAGHVQEEQAVLLTVQVLRPSGAREVQAPWKKSVRLDHVGLATLEPSGMLILREHLGLASCWCCLQFILNLLGETDLGQKVKLRNLGENFYPEYIFETSRHGAGIWGRGVPTLGKWERGRERFYPQE